MHVFNKILNFEILNSRFYSFSLVVVVVLKLQPHQLSLHKEKEQNWTRTHVLALHSVFFP